MFMIAFFGGQIKQECRGNLALVIAMDENLRGYATFLYPIESEEFVHLTGVMDIKFPIERAYIGVSHETGRDISTLVNCRRVDLTDLRNIDGLVVMPYFLDKCLDEPKRVVLGSTSNGYRVVEAD